MELDRVGVGDLVGRGDHGPEREAAPVHLGLGQVERVVALDVPGRDVVGQCEAEDRPPSAEDEGQLGLGGGEGGVSPATDGLIRITSYNVCYTKLLRFTPPS